MYDFQKDMIDGNAENDRQRIDLINKAWRAYDGEHPQPLAVKPNKPNHNVIVNLCALAVDVGVVFMFGGEDEDSSEIRFAVDGDDAEMNEQERWLDTVWEENQKMATLYKLGTNGGVTGDAYIKMVTRPNQLPRLIVLDPASVVPEWEPHDIDDVWRWTILFGADQKGVRVEYREVITRDSNGRWRIENYEMKGHAKEFTLTSTADWPYMWSPIHHCQNLPVPNIFWGKPDITEDLRKLNHSINRNLSNTDLILGYHAHPKTWGKGLTAEQMDVAADGTILINSPDGELSNLEMDSDLVSSLNHYNALRQTFFEQAHVPQVALGGVTDASRVSSLALRVMYAPLFQNTFRKKSTYGPMLKQLNAHLLELGGFGKGVRVRNRWPQVLPDEPYQTAQTALLHQQAGASKKTILQRLGYKPLEEAAQRAAERVEEGNLGEALLAGFDGGVGVD